jgi:hypothetical protein
MRVNLNKIAEQIVPEYRHQQFVDSVVDLNLNPIYEGTLTTYYPTTITAVNRGKLRRYIFKYRADGSYEFITARKGQRNGGNNVVLADAQINITITDPNNNFSVLKNQNFTIVNSNFFTFGATARILRVNGRYLWQEKPESSFVFNTLYYSDATSKPLEAADKQNDVNWFQQGTNKYVVANNTRVVYYNNNTLAGLNGWPIQNSNVGEERPVMLDDAYLSRCFYNMPLEPYEIVFVEVFWNRFENKETFLEDKPAWLGESFTVPANKGRVYRVGKLAASNEVGEYDIVTYAQRTRIKTSTTKRGGNTVYN